MGETGEKKSDEVKIPKIIMKTWKTSEIPEKWQAGETSREKYMSDWKYVLMTDEDNRAFIEKHFPDFLTYYDAFPYNIQRADAIRYAWLYINGGLYIDCDFEFLGSLNSLFVKDSDLYLLKSANNKKNFTNALMAAKPGNKLFLDMIEEMKKKRSFLERNLYVLDTTGPVALTRVVKKTKPALEIIPSSKINPYGVCDYQFLDKCYYTDSLAFALPGSSWMTTTGKMYECCYCNWVPMLVFLLIAIALVLILVLCFRQ